MELVLEPEVAVHRVQNLDNLRREGTHQAEEDPAAQEARASVPDLEADIPVAAGWDIPEGVAVPRVHVAALRLAGVETLGLKGAFHA